MDLLLPSLHWGFAIVWLGVALFYLKWFLGVRVASLKVWYVPFLLILMGIVVTSLDAAL